jgi:cation diffusion facilitator CzcD-associated flavoprotein CzcO
MAHEHVDVLIVGAGLTGIGAARHLQDDLPHKSYAILEARDAIGGTWDLFRYPGIRSDSDMHTLGYRFKPWTAAEAIADGPAILEYVRETAREAGIDGHIRFGHRVVRAEWSTPDAHWTVDVERTDTGERLQLTCGFIDVCAGYYRYDKGYLPEFPGRDRFQGTFIHPQHWPQDLDYAGKRVVVIGSGATAVTLVPAMAPDAAHVTMLQRSPTYILSLPAKDPIANGLRRILPDNVAYFLTRWKNVIVQAAFYRLSRRRPKLVRAMVRRGVMRQLPPGFAVDTHFNPRYDPWDQRVCLVPDGDLFRALGKGTASIVTDEVETFTETGLKLRSGTELEADIVVAATGLDLQVIGGLELAVDGRDVVLPETMAYKGMMLSGVPNFAFTVGYTNASWTLKADLTAEYVCRLLRHMDEHGHRQCMPGSPDPAVSPEPILDFTSGYVQRSVHKFPMQGDRQPWRLRQNYAYDLRRLRHGDIEDGVMRFSSPAPVQRPAVAA